MPKAPKKPAKNKNLGGRPRLSAAELAARGSWRAKQRAKDGDKPKAAKSERVPDWKPLTKKQLDAIILEVPGYDPHRDSEGCWFDYRAANKAIEFFETRLRHVEGAVAGKLFILERWQKAVIANLMGWKRIDEAGRTVRRFREAFLMVARKNGKTPMCGGLALYLLMEDGEPGAQVVSAAAERNQAALLFRHARGFVQRSQYLEGRAQVFAGVGQRSIVLRDDPAASYVAISADAFTKHGLNLHAAIIDELHAQPNRELVDTLLTSMASANRVQPLAIFITTSDYHRESICNEKYDYAVGVRDGLIPDPNFLPIIYEVPKDADWTDPANWPLANPNLGVSVSADYLERECRRAQETPGYENTFRRLHLNQKTEQANRVIPMDRWESCSGHVDVNELAGRSVFCGLDIGATSDFTAFSLVFPHDDGEVVAIPINPTEPEAGTRKIVRRSFTTVNHFWLPEIHARRDPRMTATIDSWKRAGFIRTTEGDTVDYDLVLDDILRIVKPFTVEGIAFDRGFQGGQMGTNLQKHFAEKVVQFPQGILSMNAPFRELLELLMARRIVHDGNPVLTWMASNTAAEERGGLMKPSKDRSNEKIDGITSLTMAIALAIQTKPQPKSVYESRGVLAIGDDHPGAHSTLPGARQFNWQEL